MLPLGAGLVFCEEMVAAWRQTKMVVVGLGERAGHLTPASPISSHVDTWIISPTRGIGRVVCAPSHPSLYSQLEPNCPKRMGASCS